MTDIYQDNSVVIITEDVTTLNITPETTTVKVVETSATSAIIYQQDNTNTVQIQSVIDGGNKRPTVEEVDGTPSVTNVNTIKVSNGTLTDDGSGVVTIDTSKLLDVVTKVSAYTVLSSNDLVMCSGTFTVTLPNTSGLVGKQFHIKNISSGSITVDGYSSENIDDETTQILDEQDDDMHIVAITGGWKIL